MMLTLLTVTVQFSPIKFFYSCFTKMKRITVNCPKLKQLILQYPIILQRTFINISVHNPQLQLQLLII